MGIIEDFILVFIELTAIMYLWDILVLENCNSKFKRLIVIISVSLCATYIDYNKISFIFTYIFLIITISYIYKRNIVSTSLEVYVLLIIISIFQLAIITIFHMFGIIYKYNFKFNIIGEMIILCLVLVLKHLICKKFHGYLSSSNNKAIYCFVINSGLYSIISKLIWEYDKTIILNNKIKILLILIGIFLVQTYVYIYVSKLIEIKKELEIKNRYTPILDNMIEEIRRRQHDFKNNINTISGIVEIADDNELRNNLRDYMSSLDFPNINLGDIMYIESTIIKSIIYSKICEAKKRGIEFTYNVRNNSLEDILKDHEISDILNNLINNAFEVLSVKESDRIVVLNILMENGRNIIEIKNNGEPIKSSNIKSIFKRGFSTKNKNRGYGLYNVKKIVNSNNGTIYISLQDDFTIFCMLF